MKQFFAALLLLSANSYAGLVEYQLSINYGSLNKSGKPVQAMLVNNSYPGPVLKFREGDMARISVTNHLDVDSSVHWHGLLVPAAQDGVPYLSSLPIAAGATYVYEFPLKQAGTYWYHSHTDLQEQSGVHGGIVVEPAHTVKEYDHEAVLVLQDWIDQDPHEVLANLKKDGDYYALQKDSVVSIAGYIENQAIAAWFENRWMRMEGMDVSDVAYDAFLINGEPEQHLFPEALPGETVRLRLVNAAASTYFVLHSAELPLQVVSADGLDVAPVKVDEVLHAVAETYDLVVTVPESGAAELRATAQDRSGFASVYIGSGQLRQARDLPELNRYVSHAEHAVGKAAAHDHQAMYEMPRRLAYKDLETVAGQMYAGSGTLREMELRLTGSMEGYNWSFDNTPLSRADKIEIRRGETVRFKLVNETMMHHPLHLHGHFFRVVTGDGEGPIKHTVDVPPLETVMIEFAANEEKDWFFHCHNLYHAKTGMARVLRYQDYEGSPELEAARSGSSDIRDDDFYQALDFQLTDDFMTLEGAIANAQHAFEYEFDARKYKDERVELKHFYRFGRYWQFMLGAEKEEDEPAEYIAGFTYALPFLIDVEVFVNDEGEVEAEFSSEFQLSKRLVFSFEHETTETYEYTLEYRLDEQVSLETVYSDDLDFSLGVKIRF